MGCALLEIGELGVTKIVLNLGELLVYLEKTELCYFGHDAVCILSFKLE